MLTYRGDKFVKGKKFTINENKYYFSRRENDKLIFEAISDGSKLVMTENEYNNAEKILTEKVNQENKETNEIIGKVLRSKGLARKYEDLLKSKGISINYDSPQGVSLKGPNGRVLSASSKEVYGPHTPDSSGDRYDKNGYRRDADGHYKTTEKRDTYYGEERDKEQAKLDKLEAMERDDIIRAYPDKTTDEALKAHENLIAKTKENVEYYEGRVKSSEKNYQYYLKNAKKDRRNAEYNRLRTRTPKEKADSSIDYLNYLTKPANDYMNTIRDTYKGYKNLNKSNPANGYDGTDKNANIDKYRELKGEVNRAQEDVHDRTASSKGFHYSSAAMTDEELEAKIQSMRDELEKKIEDLRSSNKANSAERDKYVKILKDKEKELDKFLKSKGIRESVLDIINGNKLTEGEELDFRAGYEELYGEKAEYTQMRQMIEALEAIAEQADEDNYRGIQHFEDTIRRLSRIYEDLEEFYERN